MQKITSKPYYHDCCKNYQKLANKIPYLLFFQDHESDDTRKNYIWFGPNLAPFQNPILLYNFIDSILSFKNMHIKSC